MKVKSNEKWRSSKTKDNLFKALNNVKEFILFDCETTGISSTKDRIIQIAGLKFSVGENYTLTEVGRIDLYIRPPFEISEFIQELTGITNEFLYEFEEEEYVFPEIHAFFGNCPTISAYNSVFDKGFLTAMYKRNGENIEFHYDLDILQMARDLVSKEEIKEMLKSEGEESPKENYKLGTIARLYGVDDGIAFHSAMDDVIASSRLLETFIHEYQELDKEEKNKPDIVKSKAEVISIKFWEGFQGFSRIYVNTNIGTVYYDIRRKSWGEKDIGCIEKIDMEQLERDAYVKAGATDEHEFARFKG